MRFFRLFFCAMFFAFAGGAKANAENGAVLPDVLVRAPEGDWAIAWLDALFRGVSGAGGEATAHWANIASAFRYALGVYSIGMLVLGGFILLYHIVVMVVETAHSGVPMGRRANQTWAPIRFVLALALLIPIGGGLNAGQYMIVKLAEAGSSLASHAWHSAVDHMRGGLNAVITPHTPDALHLAAATMEMVMCRDLYHQYYATMQTDPNVVLAGDIDEFHKIPPQRLAPETWRYSNLLHTAMPLCGEYQFMSQPQVGVVTFSAFDNTANDLANFAHSSADRLILQAQSNGSTNAFLASHGNGDNALRLMVADYQKTIDTKIKASFNDDPRLINQTLDESAHAGWIAAGNFVPELARMQAVADELAAKVVPSVQAPLFGHQVVSHAFLNEAIANDPVLSLQSPAELAKLKHLYEQMNEAMKKARAWLYNSSSDDAFAVDAYDVRDQLDVTTGNDTGFYLYGRILNASMISSGIFQPQGDAFKNPIASLAETGRRDLALGNEVFAMASMGLSTPNTLACSVLFIALAFCVLLSGGVLIFVVPFIPFLRFFLGVIAWLLMVCEAVLALPLVALAHITPNGEGLSGSSARHAYWLWLGLFMRPALTLFGFLVGFALLAFAVTFLNSIFNHLAEAMNLGHGSLLTLPRVALIPLYAILVYAAVNMVFKTIFLFPEHALHWLGRMVAIEGASGVVPSPANVATAYAKAISMVHTSGGGDLLARITGKVSTAASSSSQAPNGKNAGNEGKNRDLFPQPHNADAPAKSSLPETESNLKESAAHQGKNAQDGLAKSPALSPYAANLPTPDKKDGMSYPSILDAVSDLATLVERLNPTKPLPSDEPEESDDDAASPKKDKPK